MKLKSMLLAYSSLWMCLAATGQAESPKVPAFTDYPVTVSSGPFSNTLVLTKEQKEYSSHWKKIANAELTKNVNFAGYYRFFSYDGVNGKECPNGGECGWVINKKSGEVVSELPGIEGSSVYYQVADNGTPVGMDFGVSLNENSSLFSITAQMAPNKIRVDSYGYPARPPCETNYYKFENNKFIRIFEDKNGCNVN